VQFFLRTAYALSYEELQCLFSEHAERAGLGPRVSTGLSPAAFLDRGAPTVRARMGWAPDALSMPGRLGRKDGWRAGDQDPSAR